MLMQKTNVADLIAGS